LSYRKSTRRAFLKGTLAAASVAGLAGVAYSREIEPRELSIEQITIFVKRLPPALQGFRIGLLSDLHYGAYVESVLQSAVQAANQAKPDLMLLGGDFVTWHHDNIGHLSADAHAGARAFSNLQAPCGVIAILGNHDYSPHPEVVSGALKENGILLLRNQAKAVEKDGARIWVGGIDDALEGRPDLDATFAGIPQTETRILLAHEPDFANEVDAAYRVDLQLSGHSHGGQVRIPLIGPPVLPPLAERYPMGHYRLGEMQIYTTRGLGMIGPMVRFDCPPELTLLTLQAAPAGS
jgi:predicted MPP superfamily phosphohydrolase